jgi:5'-nucleotidase
MAYELENRLVIGVASSALFDLRESDAFFQEHGEDAYRIYQDEHIDIRLEPGVAFPFVRRLLALNDLRPGDPLVEVIILSKNDPNTGLRVMRSIAAHHLPMTRAAFTRGRSPHEYIPAFSMSLFLSASENDVRAAIDAGYPAGQVLPSAMNDDEDGGALRVAFDFDGVVGDDEPEKVFQGTGGLAAFQNHEVVHRGEPVGPGPLKQLHVDLNMIQHLERERMKVDKSYQPRLQISLVTARNAPAHERAVFTLMSWGVGVDDAFFLGGVEKAKVLKAMKPHLFFDDQAGHLTSAAEYAASVHVPYGISNAATIKLGVEDSDPRHEVSGPNLGTSPPEAERMTDDDDR